MADEQFIIFRLGDQEYGLPIAAVDEIARPPDHITRLPKAPAFIDGVMNLRGIVVPIVDLRRRFDLSIDGTGGRASAFLSWPSAAGKTGFMVDSVSESHEGAGRRHSAGAGSVGGADAPDRPGRQSGSAGSNDPAGRSGATLDQVEADVLAKFDRTAST